MRMQQLRTKSWMVAMRLGQDLRRAECAFASLFKTRVNTPRTLIWIPGMDFKNLSLHSQDGYLRQK